MKSSKNHTIRFRVNNDTKTVLDSKVAASGMSLSEFMRQIIDGSVVQPVSNGKEVVRQVAMLHEDMLNYHNDMVERLQSLKNAVEDNNELLRQANKLFNSPVIQETIAAQLPQYLPYFIPLLPKEDFPPILRCKHDMIFAVPFRM